MTQLYLAREQTGDVIFIVEEKEIPAHKNVLAVSSPKFNAQFYGPGIKDEGKITIEDAEAAAFEEFLQFFYLDEPQLTLDNIAGVMKLADQSLCKDFLRECGRFLWATKDASFKQIQELSRLYRLNLHNKRYVSFVAEHMEIHSRTPTFLEWCDPDTMGDLLKFDSLKCKEIDLFHICMDWAKSVCCDDMDEKDVKITHIRAALGQLLYDIRFLSMTFDEFNSLLVEYPGFFTEAEIDEIQYMLGNLTYFRPKMFTPYLRNPKIFSISRIVHREQIKKIEADIMPVSFSSNMPFRFKGFTMGFEIFNSIICKLVITIKRGDDDQSRVVRPKFELNDCEDYGETEVVFEEAIVIDANERVQVDLKVKPIMIEYKYELTEGVGSDDINFIFNVGGASPDPGILLLRLHYYRDAKL